MRAFFQLIILQQLISPVAAAFVSSPVKKTTPNNNIKASVSFRPILHPVGGSFFDDAGNTMQQQRKTRTSSSSAAAPSALSAMPVSLDGLGSMEDILYNIESVAASLASVSLKDPTNLFASLPIMYGAGLITSFSPCVWGLLPLTMSYISTAAGERKDQRTLYPTIAFALGLASIFCTLGIVVSTFGGVFGGTENGSDGILSGNIMSLQIAAYGICFAMGLQVLGFVQLPLLSLKFLQPKSNAGSSNGGGEDLILLDASGSILSSADEKEDEGGSLIRTFLLGGSSALVASPCATPVLTSILAYVASAQNPFLGASLLLMYTLGYSTPLLIISSTGGQALVEMKNDNKANNGSGAGIDKNFVNSKIVPWITPITGGILLWYATGGILVSTFGDPSLAALSPILE